MTDAQNQNQEANIQTEASPEEVQALLVEAFNLQMREIAGSVLAAIKEKVLAGLSPAAAASACALVAADTFGALAIEQEQGEGSQPAEEYVQTLLANAMQDMQIRAEAAVTFYRGARAEYEKNKTALDKITDAANDANVEGEASDAA